MATALLQAQSQVAEAQQQVTKLEADRDTKPKIRKEVSNAKGEMRNEQAADMDFSDKVRDADENHV